LWERTIGGHNYGYTVNGKYVKKIPKEVLEKKLYKAEKYYDEIGNSFREKVKQALDQISFLENEIKKQKVKK
jgi:hypothetical protein